MKATVNYSQRPDPVHIEHRENGVSDIWVRRNPEMVETEEGISWYAEEAYMAIPTDNCPSESEVELDLDNWFEFVANEGPLDGIRAAKIRDMSSACNAAIVGGVDVELSEGGTCHFSLTDEDQINLYTIKAMADAGVERIPYHADGAMCRYYSAADALAIAEAATRWKLYHQSYFNSLKKYVLSLNTAEEIAAISYGVAIPEEFQSDVLRDLIGATA